MKRKGLTPLRKKKGQAETTCKCPAEVQKVGPSLKGGEKNVQCA